MEKISLAKFLQLKKEDLATKVICFPTDTVYGIGALYDDVIAIEKIYKLKNRSKSKPLVNLCSNVSQIEDLGFKLNHFALDIMNKYWPGALTIIIQNKEVKESFRMPDSKVALALINRFFILKTTSVNESGEKELNSYELIYEKFGKEIDYFITDLEVFSNLPSTVIDISSGEIVVLREGSIKF